MKKQKVNQWFGWRPDKPDIRDFKFEKRLKAELLPPKVDLRDHFPPCYDQGALGSCTANAIAGLLHFDMLKQQEKRAAVPSRLFIYYNERVMEGTIDDDAGAEIRDGIKSVARWGSPNERYWPYIISKFTKKPSKTAYTRGEKRQSLEYRRLNNESLVDLKSCLAQGFPFTFGFTVYENFESRPFEDNWVLSVPVRNEAVLGGHAVVAVGYDNEMDAFLVRNSWGEDWGIDGYYWQKYDYLTNWNLADDFWVITKVE